MDGIKVTNLYFGLCWISVGICILLLAVGLWKATIAPSEKGFYAMSYLLSLFTGVAVQKNLRGLGGSDDRGETAAAGRAGAE